MKLKTSSVGLSLLTAFASSLCCIAPILAIVAGTSSFAANFAWIEPFRPYLMGITFLVLGFAWYQKWTPQVVKTDCCSTENKAKNGFLQSKKFLGIVTLLALILTAFPYFSNQLMGRNNAVNKAKINTKINAKTNSEMTLKTIKSELNEINVTGMSCASCEHHITSQLSALKGILNVSASYENSNAVVEFDPNLIDIQTIKASIDSTGYQSNNFKKIEKK
jgi:mercuric ion transport protein